MKFETKTDRGKYEAPLCECCSVRFESNIMSKFQTTTETYDVVGEDDEWM